MKTKTTECRRRLNGISPLETDANFHYFNPIDEWARRIANDVVVYDPVFFLLMGGWLEVQMDDCLLNF